MISIFSVAVTKFTIFYVHADEYTRMRYTRMIFY